MEPTYLQMLATILHSSPCLFSHKQSTFPQTNTHRKRNPSRLGWVGPLDQKPPPPLNPREWAPQSRPHMPPFPFPRAVPFQLSPKNSEHIKKNHNIPRVTSPNHTPHNLHRPNSTPDQATLHVPLSHWPALTHHRLIHFPKKDHRFFFSLHGK